MSTKTAHDYFSFVLLQATAVEQNFESLFQGEPMGQGIRQISSNHVDILRKAARDFLL